MLDAPHGTATQHHFCRSLLSKPEARRFMGLSRCQLDGLIADGRLETKVVRDRTYVTAGSVRRAIAWLQGDAAA